MIDVVNFNDVKNVSTEEYFKNNEFAVDIFLNKYSHIKKDGNKETPAEVFWRISNILSEFEENKEHKEHYRNIWFTLMYDDWFRPGGSILSGVGSNKKVSTGNCFTKDTEFITTNGIKKFEDFYDGDEVDILTRNGSFKKATIKYFGKQEIFEIVFRREKFRYKIKTTEDHLWITKNYKLKQTKNLKISEDKNNSGDKIKTVHKKTGKDRTICNIGFIHGIVFGDGYYEKGCDFCRLPLRGDSVQFKDLFMGFGYKLIDHGNKVDIYNLPNYMKKFPNFNNINSEYFLGFFVGWLAADGHIDKYGRCELSSAKEENLKTIKSYLPKLGIYCSNIRKVRDESPFDGNKEHKLFSLYIWKKCLFKEMFRKQNHIDNYKHYKNNKKVENHSYWVIESKTPLNYSDDVWCVVEPKTESFVLNYGLPTHNCTTVAIEGDTLEDISKAEYTLWKCAAYRQGMGIEMSPLRPRNSLLGNAAERSTGIVPWCKKFDSIGDYVGQKGRRPAILISLLVNHPDILEFITSKKERGNIENANISVQITNDFMDCLENGKMWKLHFTTERETIEKEIDPNEIIDLISETAIQSGEPGIQYRDLLQKGSMTHAIYKATGDERFKLVSSNACVTGDQTVNIIVNGKHQIMTIEDVLHLFEEQSDILILSSNKDGDREYKPLKNIFLSRKNVELLKITDEETGKSIKCTPDHEIYTKNRGYVQVQNLKMDDELKTILKISKTTKKLLKIEKLEYKDDVYDLTVEDNENFYCSDILVHNCSEKFMSPYALCNLGSINVEKFSTDKNDYRKQLEYITPYLVRLLDNVVTYEIEKNLSPIKEQKEIITLLRQIGLGVTNVHGWFLKDNIQYDSDEAIEKIEDFFKHYSYYTFNTSIELGKEKGNSPAFELAKPKDLMESSLFRNMVNEFYDGDPNKIQNLRNMELMSIAPVGTISGSFSKPCISYGIEPIIGAWYWRKTRALSKNSYDYYFIIPDRVKEYILSFVTDEEDYKLLEEFNGSVRDNDGEKGKELIGIIEKYVTEGFFKPAHEINYNKKIEMLSKVYKWMDSSISHTFNLPVTATKEDVKKIYIDSFKNDVRAVSVYREGSREGILIFEDPITNRNKYENKNYLCEERPEIIQYHCAPKRPESLECEINHCIVKGEKWLVIIGMFNGIPYELFAGEQEDLYLPKSVKDGIIKKNGGGKYSLVVTIRKNEVEYKDIANSLMSSEQRAITRMISLSLRHGTPIEFITSQLKKSKNDITDFASAVSRVLDKYSSDIDVLEECPVCGEPMMKQEGCVKCVNCYYSRCGG